VILVVAGVVFWFSFVVGGCEADLPVVVFGGLVWEVDFIL